jgi:LmeA-like phospholipid-binding
VSFLRRLARTVVVLALFFLVLGVVVVVLGRPFVERIAARSIEDRLGTPVSVSIDVPVRPGIARGDVGKVTVHADQFERNGLALTGAQAVYRGVHLNLSDLIGGNVRLRYSSVNFQGTLTQAALRAYLKPLLAGRGVPSKHLVVLIHQGDATLRAGSLRSTVRVKVVAGSSIQLIAVNGSALLVGALETPIQLGPLPDGVQLTGIVLSKGFATILGRGEAGTIRA